MLQPTREHPENFLVRSCPMKLQILVWSCAALMVTGAAGCLASVASADDYLNEGRASPADIIDVTDLDPGHRLMAERDRKALAELTARQKPYVDRLRKALSDLMVQGSEAVARAPADSAEFSALDAAAKGSIRELSEVLGLVGEVCKACATNNPSSTFASQDVIGRADEISALQRDTSVVRLLQSFGDPLTEQVAPAERRDVSKRIIRLASRIVGEADRDDMQLANEKLRKTTVQAIRLVRSNHSLSLGDLRDYGLKLRKTFGDPGEAQGANFRYLRNFDTSENTVSATFALSWSSDAVKVRGRRTNRRVRPSVLLGVGGNLTSGDPGDDHFWEIRAGGAVVLDLSPTPGAAVDRRTNEHYLSLSALYRESQDGDIRTFTGQAIYTPKFGPWALGVRRGHETISRGNRGEILAGVDANGCCLPPTNVFSWEWQASGTLDVGWSDSGSTVLENDGTILRPFFKVSGRVYLDKIGRDLMHGGLDSRKYPYLEASYGAWYFPLEGNAYRDWFEAVLKLPLNEVFDMNVTYHNGAVAPSFGRTETLELSLGIRI